MRSKRIEIEVEVLALEASDFSVAAIQKLDGRCFRGSEGTDIASELEKPFTRAWCARIPAFEGEMAWAGYLVSWHVADELHILNVATDPDHRRRGIGRSLLDRAITFARENQVRLVLLEVRRSNLPAIRLYRRFRFFVLGIRKSYYVDNGEDAVEMGLVLDPETGNIVACPDEIRLEEV